LGYHARRIYFPILQDFLKKKEFVIGLKSQEKIRKENRKKGINTIIRNKNILINKIINRYEPLFYKT
jgi:predicted nucleic-acid-binding protein